MKFSPVPVTFFFWSLIISTSTLCLNFLSASSYSKRPHTHTHARAHARTHTHARAHTGAHTHTHTHTHTLIKHVNTSVYFSVYPPRWQMRTQKILIRMSSFILRYPSLFNLILSTDWSLVITHKRFKICDTFKEFTWKSSNYDFVLISVDETSTYN